MQYDIVDFLTRHKDFLIPAVACVLLGIIVSLIVLAIKVIFDRASAKDKLIMISIGIVLLLVVVVSLIAIYVFFRE